MTSTPYYADDSVTLHLGDMREVLPQLVADGLRVDAILADPPYGETSLAWDRWPDGWPTVAATAASSMWCFGSMRMFLDRHDEFGDWKLSQDVVWEKSNGSGAATDRFRRVHEFALHWYRGPWGDVYHQTPTVLATPEQIARNSSAVRTSTPAHHGAYGPAKKWTETGTRLARSVLRVQSMRGRAIHPTEKPVPLLVPLLEYAVPPGGTVVDLFAGSGPVGEAARLTGLNAVLIEADERYAEAIARRLAQDVLPIGGVA